MAGHKRYQKLTAVLTLLGLVLALIPVAVLALPQAQAVPSDPAHPIIGGPDDPWPSDPSREEESEDIKSAGSIALVFEFGNAYGYQSMGGVIPNSNASECRDNPSSDNPQDWPGRANVDGLCRNWGQNKELEKVITPLKGSPLSIGIYHYARKMDRNDGINGPDLKATSLADEAGFNKVINKIRSLDASDGYGGARSATWFGGNSEWGLGKLYRDMYQYQEQQKKEHAGDPNFVPRPLYSKIIIMSVSDPHWRLEKNTWWDSRQRKWVTYHDKEGNFVVDPDNMDTDRYHDDGWNDPNNLERNPGRLVMLDVVRMIRGLGADIRTVGMGNWIKRWGESRTYFMRYLTGDDPYYPDKYSSTENYQYINFPDDRGDPSPYWFGRRGEYFKGENSKDGIANGTYAETMRRWLWEDTHFSLTSDLVDQDFRYVKPNAGQPVDFKPTDTSVNPQNYTTGKDGRVVLSLTKAKMTGGVDITFPRHTTEYWHTKLKGQIVRCNGLNRTDGVSKDFTPEQIDDPTHNKVGFKISAQHISDLFSIKCATYSRPLQKLTFQKFVSAANDQIRYEVGGKPPHYENGAKYSYQWECKDPLGDNPDDYVVAPTTAGTQQVGNLNLDAYLDKLQVTPTPVPVGTQCKITETIEMPGGYTVDTASLWFSSDSDFKGTNFAIDEAQTQKIKDQKQSVKNIIVGKIKLYDSTVTTEKDSLLVSSTVYDSLRAHVEVTLKFSNSQNDRALAKKIAEGKLPKKVPVYYNCRFMADPTKLPELPETNTGTYPGYVGVDWVGVESDGTAKVILGKDKNGKDAWPVGTHCLLSTVPPNQNINGPKEGVGESVNIPGVVVKDSYESTICQEDHATKPTASKKCSNNYFWVHSPGTQVINITEDLQRLEGKLRVTKQLSGEAASQGIGQDFPMHLTCTDEGVTLPIDGQDTLSFGVKSTESRLVEKVPAGVRCDLTEDSIGAPAAVPHAQLTMPGVISTTITDTTIETPVNVNNNLSYKLANLAINHKIKWGTPLPDSTMQTTIKGKDNKVTVSCKLPAEAGQITKELVIPANNTETTSKSLENLPVGSQCTVQSEPQDIAGLDVRYQAPSQTVTITESGSTADLETKYSLPRAGDISVQGLVKSRPQYDALKIPDTLDAQVKCTTSAGTEITPVDITLDLKNGTSTIVPARTIPEGSDCRVEARPADLEGRIDWKWANVDDINQASSSPVNAHFTSPSETGSVSVVIRLWAKTKTTTVNLTANSSMWTSKDANSTATADQITVPEEWRKAVLGIAPNDADSTKVPLKVTCQYKNGAVTSTATFSPELPNGGSDTPLEVPANWDCTATTNQATLKIPGTDMQDPAWSGAGGTASTDKYSYQWTSADGQNIALQRDYRLQLATFNLKKKVGGEGVTIVSGDKHFPVSWSCSLNGKPINIPAPRDIGLRTDAQATFGDDLPDRLKESKLQASASTEMGRFQQGEWHVIDALPAGAVCTVTEDRAGAEVDETVWSHYWEITNGYRGRDREGNEKCTDASDKCRAKNEGGVVKVQVLLPRDQKAGPNGAFIPNDPHDSTIGDNLKDENGVPRNPVVPDTLPENFAGAMISWNNYVFEKTQVKVSLTNTGNGAPLARGKTFDARLYCGPPPLIGADGAADLPADSSAAAIIRVTLSFKESATEPGKWEDVVANQLIPVGYRCVLAEAKFPELDAKVTTTIANATDPAQSTQTADASGLRALFSYNNHKPVPDSQVDDDPNLNLMSGDQGILGFIVHRNHVSAQGTTQKQSLFTINNDFDRPAAKLKIKQVVTKDDTVTQKSFGQALVDNNDVGYTLHYECTDKYLLDEHGKPLVYKDSKALPADSELNLFSGEGGGGTFVPATSQCVFWHVNQDEKDPITKYNHKLLLQPTATVVTPGAEDQFESVPNQLVPDPLKVVPANLDSTGKNETTLTFEDTYFIPFVIYQIGTAAEGDRRDEALPADTTKYQYSYSCVVPDGLPVPNAYPTGYPKVEGTITEAVRGNFVPLEKVIGGSTCKVTGTKAASAKPYLKLAANWVPWDQNTNVLGITLDDEVKFTNNPRGEVTGKAQLTDSPFEITLDQNNRRGVVLYTVYTHGTKVRIYKATAPKPDGQLVPDATFSLYPAKTDGTADTANPIELNPVEGKSGMYESKTELAPGNYLLGNTNAGKNAGERFPFGWKFGVVLDPANQEAEQNTKVKLDPEAFSSGLIATYAPAANTSDPWEIELADVKFGQLPLTGGYLPWLWLVGISLVAASAAVMWHRRRE